MGFLSSLFGIKGSQPKTSTVVQAQQLPKEISPFVTEILKEAQDLYKQDVERGYDPYTGETIAPLTPQEEQAMAGIEGLVGTTTPLLEESLETLRTGAEKFTPETAQEYMSPYQRAVTDIEKREAGRQFDVAQQARDAQAAGAGAGSLMGTRSAILEAEAARNQQQLLADIEAKGLQSAFTNAQQQFEAQKARERQMAGDVARTGTGLFQAGLAEQGALQTVGEQRRQLGQTALDEAYFRFLEEQQFPQSALAQYSGMVYGNPLADLQTSTKTTTGTPFVASPGQQMLGLGLSGLNVFGMGGGFSPGGFSMGNIYSNKAGGGPVIKAQAGSRGSPLGSKPLAWYAKYGTLPQRVQAKNLMGGPQLKSGIQKGPAVGPLANISRSAIKPTTAGGVSGLLTGVPKGKVTRGQTTVANIPDQSYLQTPAQQAQDIWPQGISGTGGVGTGVGGVGTGAFNVQDILEPVIRRLAKEDIGTFEGQMKSKRDRLEQTPGFSAKNRRTSFDNYMKKLKKLQAQQNKQIKEKRSEFNEEDRKASEEFFAAQEEAIKEGNNADLIASALDQANVRQRERGGGSIIEWFTDALNLGTTAIGARRKEQGKELRELAKEKYKEARTDRKSKKAEELADLNRESLNQTNNLVKEYGLEKELMSLDRDIRTAVMAEIAADQAFENRKLTKVEVLAKLLDQYEEAGTTGDSKHFGKSMISYIDRIEKDVARSKGFMISEQGEIMIDKNTPLTKAQRDVMNAEVNKRKQEFSNRLSELDPTMSSYSAMSRAYAEIIPRGYGQAGRSSGVVPPNTQNYPVLKPNQTGLVKNKIYYSPKVGPVKYTGTGFVIP